MSFKISSLALAVATLSTVSIATPAGLDRSTQPSWAFTEQGTFAYVEHITIDPTIEGKDNKNALTRLKEKRNEVKLTIDYIYKCRNQIVHNGYVDKNLVPYLVNFSEAYANSLFNRILEVYSDGEYNLQDYFTKELYDGIFLERKLANGNHYNLGLDK